MLACQSVSQSELSSRGTNPGRARNRGGRLSPLSPFVGTERVVRRRPAMQRCPIDMSGPPGAAR
eukprot:7165060-Pyramimonas_sp.AAC.1